MTLRSSYAASALRVLAAAALASAVWPQSAAALLECPVSFFVEESAAPAALRRVDFGISYATAKVAFAGSGAKVQCNNQVAEATAVFDDDNQGRIDVSFVSETGIPTFFKLLAVCRARSEQVPAPADVEVVDLVEENLAGEPVSIPIQILFPTAEDCAVVEPTTSTTSSTVTTSTTSTTSTTELPAACGDPTQDGRITASDSLLILNVSVGLATSVACLSDVNGDGGVTATDSLIVLNLAVGQSLPLGCPAC